jgi:hypothetical protein
VRSRAWKLSQSNGSSVSPPLRSYMILAKPTGNSSSARVVISRKPSSSLQPTFFWLSRSLITANRQISAGPDRDPLASVAVLVAFAKAAWPAAFTPGKPFPEPESPFWHAYLGLLQLADWTGSDEASDAFPYSEVSDGPRLLFARKHARSLLARIGFDAAPLREALPSDLSFDAVSSHAPTDIQLATAEAPGPVVVLEAETGSGKTEAALWRFAALLAAGKVEGLYFALPTRVAASQIHARVQATLDRLFAEAKFEAVRALPGDAMAGTATVRRLPNFDAQWSDDPDEIVRRSRWAAEQPKRFLAAPIAIGTTPFWWGGSISAKQANYDGNYTYGNDPKGEYRERTLPVDSFEPNPWGLYQVHGNVWEWTQDCWHDSYAGARHPRRIGCFPRAAETCQDRQNLPSFKRGRVGICGALRYVPRSKSSPSRNILSIRRSAPAKALTQALRSACLQAKMALHFLISAEEIQAIRDSCRGINANPAGIGRPAASGNEIRVVA